MITIKDSIDFLSLFGYATTTSKGVKHTSSMYTLKGVKHTSSMCTIDGVNHTSMCTLNGVEHTSSMYTLNGVEHTSYPLNGVTLASYLILTFSYTIHYTYTNISGSTCIVCWIRLRCSQVIGCGFNA